MIRRLILYAPNVNTGGGLTLLRELVSVTPTTGQAFLDARARERLQLPDTTSVTWVRPSAVDRLLAEYRLSRATGPDDTVLCFHGLPPLLGNPGRIVVFLQNRIHLGFDRLDQFAPRTRLRLSFERAVARILRYRVDTYVVQTPSMRRALVAWHGGDVDVRVCPFARAETATTSPADTRPGQWWDFLYVADGVAHKNHRRLLEAWRLLAEDGLRPTLALTLGQRDSALISKIDDAVRRHGLLIENLGELPHRDIMRAYHQAGALVFPSTSESFGLPLIEARQSGLPIVASERDFVRDVCSPVQTFDPDSAVSIARAVKRFLRCEETAIALKSPRQFLDEVLTPR